MTQREFIQFLGIIEKNKCNLRHSFNSNGRAESVAEHSWRLSIMPLLLREEFPDIDIDKVVRMCLIHDFGEAITGDIPSFLKTENDERTEDKAVEKLLENLPNSIRDEFSSLFCEMNELKTKEAKLFKALDNLEAIISHNEADITTWKENEYEDLLDYGDDKVNWSHWLMELKNSIREDTIKKIKESP